MNVHMLAQLMLCVVLFGIDRISKWYALQGKLSHFQITPSITMQPALNRGISWSLFHSENAIVSWCVTLVVSAMIAGFGYITVQKAREKKSIFAECLVLTGALSNLIDRFISGGVVDFILISYQGWSWPIFNGADILIVVGIFMILVRS